MTERNPDVAAFLAEVRAVCAKHGLILQSDDPYCGFEVIPWGQDADAVLADAHDTTRPRSRTISPSTGVGGSKHQGKHP